MELHTLPALSKRTKKRVGRGTSSGRGKQSGRGAKGDKARGKSPWYRVGGSRRSRLLKHLPQVRGIGNTSQVPFVSSLSLAVIEKHYSNGDTVSLETLLEKGLISTLSVKILAKGTFTKKVTVSVPVSQSAKEAIVSAGGTIQ